MAEHWDHDIHGLVLEVWPNDDVTVDEDCDCPKDCERCKAEGVLR